jgi:hypothetical protein
LLKKYWKAPDPTNNDPKVTFRRLKDEKRNLRRSRKYDEEFLTKVDYKSQYNNGEIDAVFQGILGKGKGPA